MRFFQRKPKPDPNSAAALLTRFATTPDKDKGAIREQLLANSSESVNELLSRLTNMRQKRKSLRKGMLQLCLILTVVMQPIWWLLFRLFQIKHGLLYGVGQTGNLLFVFSVMVYWSWNKSKHSEARLLAEFNDTRAVGPLCEALVYGDPDTKKAVRHAC